MANGSYLMALATTQMLTVQANHLEMRLLRISEEKNLKHLQQSAEISRYSSEMMGLVEAKRNELGENPTSEEYRQNMAQVEEIENEYQMIITSIQDTMNANEKRLETQQEVVETRLESINSSLEEWDKLALKKAEANAYFNNN